MKQELILLWILATASLCVGIAINQFRDNPLPWIYSSKEARIQAAVSKIASDYSSIPASDRVQNLNLAEMREFIEKGKGIVLDARPEIFHRLGHLPNALSLSREEFERDYENLKIMLSKDKNQPIAIYCSSSSCADSHMVADALIKLGHKRVFVFSGGWTEWALARLPEEKQ